MSPRVSVIIAVYNPGPGFDELIGSLLRQNLAAGELEVLLCDDGSDEATLARLDLITAEHPHLRVFKLEHSGWPGTPRNFGIDQARGKYVFFADHDDRFADQSLKRLCDYADENSSDVVAGKVVGVGRALPRGMFERNIPRAELGKDPLLEILTPAKLFRTAFLREHGIRFPDGRVRLEDHMVVMKSYFAADVISVLADYPSYYWTKRQDQPSASALPIEPEPYFEALEIVLDIVEANTEPGPFRDQLLKHWYRGKVLKRLSGRAMVGYNDDFRDLLVDTIRPLVQKRFGPEVDQYLTFSNRLKSALLRADRIDELIAFARIESGFRATARATSLSWDEAGVLRVGIEGHVVQADGSPLAFEATPEGGSRWIVPPGLDSDVLTPQLLEAGADQAEDTIRVFLRDRSDSADYQLPTDGRDAEVVAVLDPATGRSGRPLGKYSDLSAQVTRAGWTASTRVVVDEALLQSVAPLERTIGRRVFTLSARGNGQLTVKSRKLPPAPKPVVAKPKKAPTPVPKTFVGRRVRPLVRQARRIAGRARREARRIVQRIQQAD